MNSSNIEERDLLTIYEAQKEAEVEFEETKDEKKTEDDEFSHSKILKLARAATLGGITEETKDAFNNSISRDHDLDALLLRACSYSSFLIDQIEDDEENKIEENGPHKTSNTRTRKQLPNGQPELLVGGELLPYQIKGVNWLISLHQASLSGILGDEMGLGKTIQIIGLFGHLYSIGLNGPFLVTAPLPTLLNWRNEIEKWMPDVKVIVYHGSKAVRKELLDEMMTLYTHFHKPEEEEEDELTSEEKKLIRDHKYFPIIVTSYEIALMDRSKFQKLDWKYLVVDEGHRLKNPSCKLMRQLKMLKTDSRILLSGTPIQNSLKELWSMLNFVNPNIFDDVSIFERWYKLLSVSQRSIQKIVCNEEEEEKENGSQVPLLRKAHSLSTLSLEELMKEERKDWILSKLHEILKPFLLRRVKADIQDQYKLPKKIKVVVNLPMTDVQNKLMNMSRALAMSHCMRTDSNPLVETSNSSNLKMKRRGSSVMLVRTKKEEKEEEEEEEDSDVVFIDEIGNEEEEDEEVIIIDDDESPKKKKRRRRSTNKIFGSYNEEEIFSLPQRSMEEIDEEIVDGNDSEDDEEDVVYQGEGCFKKFSNMNSTMRERKISNHPFLLCPFEMWMQSNEEEEGYDESTMLYDCWNKLRDCYLTVYPLAFKDVSGNFIDRNLQYDPNSVNGHKNNKISKNATRKNMKRQGHNKYNTKYETIYTDKTLSFNPVPVKVDAKTFTSFSAKLLFLESLLPFLLEENSTRKIILFSQVSLFLFLLLTFVFVFLIVYINFGFVGDLVGAYDGDSGVFKDRWECGVDSKAIYH